MADRTGIARGTLRPCVYFSRIPDMYAVLAPMDQEKGTELARMAYNRGRDHEGRRYKDHWIWCEATTLQEIDRLQKRLVEQECFEHQRRAEIDIARRDQMHKKTGSILMQQMCSSSTTQWEKDFIRAYFALRQDKRDRYREELTHHNHFIMAREYDSKHNVEDSLPLMPGQVENAHA